MVQLTEGGNVFKDINGRSLTQRINQTDVKSTLAWLEELVPGLDLQNNTLGSTGIKDTSGDLDIAVDTQQVSKEQMVAQLTRWAQSHGFKPEDYVKKSGAAVHFKTPINGRPDQGFVQTDFMFLNNVAWSKFVLGAMPAESKYKGRERNVLMNSIAKNLGYKLNQNAGIADRATNQIISDDPDAVAKMLLNRTATRQDLASVESILQALSTDPQRDAKLADFKAHMEREGLTFMESEVPQVTGYTEVNFLARLRDRIVNQGMTPIFEADIQGGRAKGIEHLEDLVFRKGSKGIIEALAIIEHTAENTAQHATVKWDGKPAIVFGRKPDGTFVLTDVSGFGAKGYDGLATSPQAIARIMQQRGGERGELIELYAKLFPLLKAATPGSLKGYVQGDLLYTTTPPTVSGNFVFQPNTIEYRIPVASAIGQYISGTEVGVAMHTRYAEQGASKEPIGNVKFNKVPGLMLLEPVAPKENIQRDNRAVQQLKQLARSQGPAIDQLFSPADLRANGITNLPALCVDYINSIVKDDSVAGFNPATLLPGFGQWLQTKTTPSKYNNIVEYLQSPRSNMDGIVAAFAAFIGLHNLKLHVLNQLDQQHPGNEGWVLATPSGTAKAVNRFDFTRANRALNNPDQAA
jgi:hypothetical protein